MTTFGQRTQFSGAPETPKKLLVVNGHPDPRPERFCAGLAAAYAAGAKADGWHVRRLDIGALPNAMLDSFARGFFDDPGAASLLADFDWASRLAVVYPVWYDRPPQGLRAVFSYLETLYWSPAGGRRVHVVVTMDMPAFALRKLLQPGAAVPPALDVPGLIAEDPLLIGCVSTSPQEQRQEWLKTVYGYGAKGLGSSTARSGTLAAMIDRTMAHWWGGA